MLLLIGRVAERRHQSDDGKIWRNKKGEKSITNTDSFFEGNSFPLVVLMQ